MKCFLKFRRLQGDYIINGYYNKIVLFLLIIVVNYCILIKVLGFFQFNYNSIIVEYYGNEIYCLYICMYSVYFNIMQEKEYF